MSWLPAYDQGKTPADYTSGYPIHVGSFPNLTPRKNPYLDAVKSIAPMVQQYMKQKRQDEIANTLMNLEQPPRAESVDPSLQGADPTAPYSGGQEGMQAQQLYQKYQKQQSDQPSAGKYPVTMPDGSVIYVTGNEAAKINMRQSRGNAAEQKAQHFSQSAPQTSAADINRMPPSDTPIDASNLYKSQMSQPSSPASGTTDNDAVLRDARDAIAKGAPSDAVKKRLVDMGVDPNLL